MVILKAYMIFKWFQSKRCLNCSQNLPHRKKFGPVGSLSDILAGSKNANFWTFSRFFAPASAKISLNDPTGPNSFLYEMLFKHIYGCMTLGTNPSYKQEQDIHKFPHL